MTAGLLVGTSIMMLLAGFIVGLLIYFIPSFIAFSRRHPQRMWILLLNIFAGWTLLGWVGALVWSFVIPETGALDPFPLMGDTKVCPRCAERVKRAAFVCRFCGYEFGPPPPPMR
jgi:hypothetical protein